MRAKKLITRMKICGYCGKSNEDLSERCYLCGTEFASQSQLSDTDSGKDRPSGRLRSCIFHLLQFTKLKWKIILLTGTCTSIAWNFAPRLWNSLSDWHPGSGPGETDGSSFEVDDNVLDPPGFELGVTGRDLPRLPLYGAAMVSNVFGSPSFRFSGRNPVTLQYSLEWDAYPAINVSIGGITGALVIDTGSYLPVVSMKTAQECGIQPGETTNLIPLILGYGMLIREATNVTIELNSNLSVTWPKIWVQARETPIWGIIDYTTLKNLHAVINTEKRTIQLFPESQE